MANIITVHCDLNFIPIVPSMLKKYQQENVDLRQTFAALKEQEKNFTFSSEQFKTAIQVKGTQEIIQLSEVPSQSNLQFEELSEHTQENEQEHKQVEDKMNRKNSQKNANKGKSEKRILLGEQMTLLPNGKQCFIIPGFSYLLYESFKNDIDFDMRQLRVNEIEEEKSKKRPPSKQQKKKGDLEVQSPKLSASKKSLLRSPSVSKRAKSKQKRIKKKGDDKKEFIQYEILRIKNQVENVPLLNIASPWTANEIQEAQKRMVNKEYYKKLFEKQRRDKKRQEMSDEDSDFDKSNDELNEELEKYEIIEPLKRLGGGYWALYSDFNNMFQYEDENKNFSLKTEYDVIIITPLEQQENEIQANLMQSVEKESYQLEEFRSSVQSRQSTKSNEINLLIVFMPQLLEQFVVDLNSVKLKFQEYDFINETIKSEICQVASTSVQGISVKLPRREYVLRSFPISCQYGYSAIIASNEASIQCMDKFQYLQNVHQWNVSQFTIVYPNLKGYRCLFKYNVQVEQKQEIFMRININPSWIPFCKLLLFRQTENELNYSHLNIQNLQKLKIQLDQGSYRIIMEGHFPQALAEGQFDLFVCHKVEEDPQFELENQLDPVIYTQQYIPNKNGIIFKLHMYALENTTCSMDLNLFKQSKSEEELQSDRFKTIEEMKQRLIFLELLEGDKIIFQAKGMNSGHMVHFKFLQNKNYRLVARYCLIEFPEAQYLQEETISSEIVCFVMDTDKEDKEEAIRQTWEQAQPGRADMAKINRARFIALQKPESELTEEEKALTQQTLKDRRKAYKQFVQSGQQKETNVKKKEEKKQQGKKQEIVEEEVQETDRLLEGVEIPKAENHQNEKIKSFIKHIEGPRIQMYPPGTNPKLKSQQEKINQIEAIYIQSEDQQAKMRENVEKRTIRHVKSPSQGSIFLNEKQSRKQFENIVSEYKGKREQYRSKISARTEKADFLTTLLQSEEIDIQELVNAIEQAKQHQCKEVQIKNAEKVLFNLRCEEVSTQIEQNLEESNIEGLEQNLKNIEEMKLKISKYLLDQLNDAILGYKAEQLQNQMQNEMQSGNLKMLKKLCDQLDEKIKAKIDEKVLKEIQDKLGKS